MPVEKPYVDAVIHTNATLEDIANEQGTSPEEAAELLAVAKDLKNGLIQALSQ